MATLSQYHATVNATGAHAIATLHGAQQVHVRLDDGSTAELSIHDVCLAGPTQDAAFRQAVQQVASKARLALPENTERIADAVTLVLDGAVELTAPGYGTVASQSTEGVRYQTNGTCECRDYPHAPAHFCKHRLALAILQRATESTAAAESTETAPVQGQAETTVSVVPAEHIVQIQGKPFIKFAGLLQMAHARGLVGLTARFISVTEGLALADATATFADGRSFSEAADATPANVGAQVRPHFARMALTRAKARCLRDALNVGLCSLEELGD